MCGHNQSEFCLKTVVSATAKLSFSNNDEYSSNNNLPTYARCSRRLK
jgi:hypothetical protein